MTSTPTPAAEPAIRRDAGSAPHAGAPLSCVVVRSGQEPVVVNLDLDEVEADPERVRWVDDLHA